MPSSAEHPEQRELPPLELALTGHINSSLRSAFAIRLTVQQLFEFRGMRTFSI